MGYSINYDKLKGRITEKLGTKKNFADRMNLSLTTIYAKLSNKIPFTQIEIINACDILDIDKYCVSEYFFDTKVVKNTTK